MEEKEKELNLLKKQMEDMESNSKAAEDKFKNQLKIYDELSEKLKDKEELVEKVELLSSTIKLKDDIIWRLKTVNPENSKEIDELMKS